MAITELRLSNFKCYRDEQTIPLRPLTLIFGPNSAGKSTIIQALALFREMVREDSVNVRGMEVNGHPLDLGGFSQYVHANRQESAVGICIRGEHNGPEAIRVEIKKVGTAVRLHEFEYWWDGNSIFTAVVDTERKSAGGRAALRITDWDLTGYTSSVIAEDLFQKIWPARQYPANFFPAAAGMIGDWMKAVPLRANGAVPRIPRGYFKPFTRSLTERRSEALKTWFATSGLDQVSNAEELMIDEANGKVFSDVEAFAKFIVPENFTYIGPLREIPDRFFQPFNAYSAGQQMTAWSRLVSDQSVRDKVNAWLGRVDPASLQIGTRVFVGQKALERSMPELIKEAVTEYLKRAKRPELKDAAGNPSADAEVLGQLAAESAFTKNLFNSAYYHGRKADDDGFRVELRLKDRANDAVVSIKDVGVGLSQVLPILVNAYGCEENLLAIEQPELHLHPALQADLGDVFIESALGKNKNQLILETHSEHLILRILRRIRETSEGKLPEGMPPIRPSDVSVLYVRREGDSSKVYSLPITEDGDFEEAWPDGFFPERAKELF